MDSIFNVLKDQIQEHKIGRITQVKLVVGDMTGVEDMTMRSCFEMFAESTPVEGARLVIERIPIKARCLSCGNEFVTRGWSYQCPQCKNSRIDIIAGKELYIDSIEAE